MLTLAGYGARIAVNYVADDEQLNLRDAEAVIEHMIDNGWGRIVNIFSVSGLMGFFGPTNYAAAKAGIGLADIDLIELDEAFAAQFCAVERELKWDREM